MDDIGKMAVYLLGEETIGRRTFAKRMGLSESKARHLLNQMRAEKTIKMEKAGCVLTEKGKGAYRVMKRRIVGIKKMGLEQIGLDRHNCCALVKKWKLGTPWKERDLAVRAGATGLLMLQLVGGKLQIPPSTLKMHKTYPKDAVAIMQGFEPAEKDVILACFAPSNEECERGLWGVLGHILG